MSNVDNVLSFWFEGCSPERPVPSETSSKWWKKDPAFDAEIRERFGDLVDAAAAGALDEWAETARGRLALIVLLDQFTRNLNRGSGAAFANDPKALALALTGIDNGMERELAPYERAFFCMPLMHSEELAVHDRSIAAYERMVAEAPEVHRGALEGNLKFAHAHRDIIEQWGRYPHRNEALGRETTAAEAEFLKQPGSGF